MCIHQEATDNKDCCPVVALAQQYIHICNHTNDFTTPLLAYFVDGECYNLTDKDISAALKMSATILQYLSTKGIPIERVDTHSLRSGSANALSNTQIQKMGRWQGATFKEYIWEELACFSTRMLRSMSRTFNFVNIARGVYHNVTNAVVVTDYSTPAAAA